MSAIVLFSLLAVAFGVLCASIIWLIRIESQYDAGQISYKELQEQDARICRLLVYVYVPLGIVFILLCSGAQC